MDETDCPITMCHTVRKHVNMNDAVGDRVRFGQSLRIEYGSVDRIRRVC